MDHTTTVETLKEEARAFVDERSWQDYHSPKNLAMALAIEAAELMEIFQWKTPEESRTLGEDPQLREHMGEELADVLAYLLNLSDVLQIDLSSAFQDKMTKNRKKYPREETFSF